MPHTIFLPENYNNILANASKFCPEVDMERLEELVVTVYASHAGTIQIWGRKGAQSKHTLRQIDAFGYPATALESYRIKPTFKLTAVRFVNDGTNTTTHEVTIALIPKRIAAIMEKN